MIDLLLHRKNDLLWYLKSSCCVLEAKSSSDKDMKKIIVILRPTIKVHALKKATKSTTV